METEALKTMQNPVTAEETHGFPDFVWYTLYVKSRHEFRVNELLTHAHREAFLPAIERLRKWKDRKKLVTFPLFPGYVFVHIPARKEDLLSVIKTPGVVRILGRKPGVPEPVPDVQIVSLRTLLDNKAYVEPYPYLKEGQKVRITGGPLAGVEGFLKEKRGRHLLVLSIDILQQGASVQVDASDIELV
ncbi:MAG: UpxY family transcription antiterminator [Pseudomonadota bacterium]